LYFRFGNAGSVELEASEADGNTESFGLKIMSRFAGSAGQLQRLEAGVQSGGEKSVVTALYMIALQEMTEVPFRCVDEINQGPISF
jgi:chromosome segregation ATPase